MHASTGFTLFFITNGGELLELGSDHKLARYDEILSHGEQIKRRRQMFTRIYDLVSKNLEKGHQTSRNHYNLRHRQFSKSFVDGQTEYEAGMHNVKYGPQFLPCHVKHKIGSFTN